jgi:nitrite reductase/ring-hydroxylating ferredoxin subunit
MEMVTKSDSFMQVARLAEVQATGCLVVPIAGHTLVLYSQGEQVYALDNRCPHMGFPLHRGSVKDGVLTCHWHHARFDLVSGGTFDAWADDIPTFPVQIRDGGVWVDLSPRVDLQTHQRQRLQDGLQQGISLVIAKAVIALLDGGTDPAEPFRIGIDFGTRYRQAGWGAGLTMHTCMMHLLPYLDEHERTRALYHGLSAVARDCAGSPPHFGVHPLPTSALDVNTLKRWFRQFIEVRDAEGAERCLVSAVRSGLDSQQIADMLFAAATDHRFIDGGHTLDFTNKALEALDVAGWALAEPVLASLVSGYASAERMEESNAWRNPIDLVVMLENAFAALPDAVAEGLSQRGTWSGQEQLVSLLLGEDPQAIVDALLAHLRAGCSEEELAGVVAYAAALRIAQFHTSNELSDWDTVHHTFTFAHAVHQGLRRVASTELLRGVFDAAIRVYLNRFLNLPAARLPETDSLVQDPKALLEELPTLLDRQQQVKEAGALVACYLYSGGNPDRLLAVLGSLLLREDRSFHAIQTMEAAFRQYEALRGTNAGVHVLVAAVRFLAAHAPSMRSQGQTYQMAQRLHRGDRLFEES